jgi:tetratricopeptide (TPR) repeat protein/tRNA A-37 threonylcarbamoyl transferase component Bud32
VGAVVSSEGASELSSVEATTIDGPHSDAPRAAAGEAAPSGRVGRYLPLRKLGEGAMGEVMLAYDDQLDRRVALKIVRARGQRAGDVYARMLREAQGLARLSHPNVVQVYEAGDLDGEVYLAMEYVEGETLRTWSKSQERPWREVLQRCVEAGRGLQAAHEAGLVHRDFKPDNVMIGRDGRVRVLDFGLVRAEQEPASRDRVLAVSRSSGVSSLSTNTLESELTAAHSLIGTPAYMSPEQHLRETADGRADLFAFCVTTYELLFGVRPFAGKDQGEIMRAVLQRRVTPPIRGREVPARIRKALMKGLEVTPEARWPSMAALLAALELDPWAAWRRRAAIVGTVTAAVITVGALSAWLVQREIEACQGGAGELEGVWDDAARSAVRASLTATGIPYASAAAERASRDLDAYRAGWLTMHEQACLSHRRGERSGELLDLQMSCLAQRRQELAALVGLLQDADAAVVEEASSAVGALPRIAACEDLEYLQARLRPPDDPAIAAEVAAQRGGLAEVRALERAGRHEAGQERLAALAEAAARIEYAPLLVEVTLTRGRLLASKGEYAAAEAALEEAYFEARALGHDAAAIEAALLSVTVVSSGRSDFAAADRWVRVADAEIRHGGAPLQEAELLAAAAGVLVLRGEYEGARERFSRAIAARERIFLGEEHASLVELRVGMAAALFKLGRMDDARVSLEKARAAALSAFGPGHPQMGLVLSRLGLLATRERRFAEAAAALDESLAIFEASMGEVHPRVLEVLSQRGELAIRERDFARAIVELRRAVRIGETLLGAEHASIAAFLSSLAVALHKQGETQEALAALARAVAIGEVKLGVEHPNTAIFRANYGEMLNAVGRFAEAKEPLATGLAALTRALGESRSELAPIHRELARSLLGIGETTLALSHARRAVELARAGTHSEPEETALTLFVLAQAIAASRGDEEEALALAMEARRIFVREPLLSPTKAAEIERWLRARGEVRESAR